MLAKAIANEPAANSVSPSLPRNNIEIMERVYRIKAVKAIGDASLNKAFVSFTISLVVGTRTLMFFFVLLLLFVGLFWKWDLVVKGSEWRLR